MAPLGVDFEEGGKPEYPEKNPGSQIEDLNPGSQRWEA